MLRLRALAVVGLFLVPTVVPAQGLLFNLPEDGRAINYEGTVTQRDARPGTADGFEELVWARRLSIKSVGREKAVYRGTEQDCRWVEIEVVTGVSNEEGTDPGPIGSRLYKLLIPEAVITGKSRDDQGVPVGMLPIVKGFRRVADQTTEIKARAIRVYPSISLLANYDDPEVLVQSGDPGVRIVDTETNQALSGLEGQQLRANFTMERRESRSSNEAEFWVSKDVPFGLVSWTVKVKREVKDLTDPRSSFTEVSSVEVTMQASTVGSGAESSLGNEQPVAERP